MASITKEIETLRAKIARLEAEQKKAEQREKALARLQDQIEQLFKENNLSLEDYIRGNLAQVNRIMAKIEREKEKRAPAATKPTRKKKASTKKGRSRSSKQAVSIKIPAGKYGNLPTDPDKVFVVKEKGPRPKTLKAYAEKVGLEAFFDQCRIGD